MFPHSNRTIVYSPWEHTQKCARTSVERKRQSELAVHSSQARLRRNTDVGTVIPSECVWLWPVKNFAGGCTAWLVTGWTLLVTGCMLLWKFHVDITLHSHTPTSVVIARTLCVITNAKSQCAGVVAKLVTEWVLRVNVHWFRRVLYIISQFYVP